MIHTKLGSFIRQNPKIILLATGPTAGWVDFRRISLPIFGMNYAFRIWPGLAYYANFHPKTATTTFDEDLIRFLEKFPKDKTYCQEGETFGTEIHGLPGGEFKANVFESGMSGFYGSSIFQVMQVIYSLGYREIYIVGMDAQENDHFIHAYPEEVTAQDREQAAILFRDMKRSAFLVNETKPEDLKIFNCSPVSSIKSFPYFDISKLYD